jgi:transposase
MTDQTRRVIGGVDAHTDNHCAAVLDSNGRLLATRAFPATKLGSRALAAWIESHGIVDVVGVESTGAFAAGLTRTLLERGLRVVEVNPRRLQAPQRRGKSDPIDAELAARAALSGSATAIPKHTDGIVEAIRQLTITRESAVKSRSAALHQLEDLVITAPTEIRERLATRKTIKGKTTLCLGLRPDLCRLAEPTQAARLALRTLARRIHALDHEIHELELRLKELVSIAAAETSKRLGVGVIHTSTLLITAGQNIDRLRSDAAFARICAAAPIPASSGRTTRYRLDYGGDRHANRTLHMIAVCRLRSCTRTRAYAARRTTEGLSKTEILRCLKRYIARELHHSLKQDLEALAAT